MGLSDRLKDLKTKAVDATVERSDKIHEAVEKVASTADERTGGKYRERIQNASAKAGSLVDGLKSSDQEAGAQSEEEASVDTQAAPTAGPESAPPAAGADAPPTP
jgi:TRAP-type C4-dicarboxylate transport system substrate-binding protein